MAIDINNIDRRQYGLYDKNDLSRLSAPELEEFLSLGGGRAQRDHSREQNSRRQLLEAKTYGQETTAIGGYAVDVATGQRVGGDGPGRKGVERVGTETVTFPDGTTAEYKGGSEALKRDTARGSANPAPITPVPAVTMAQAPTAVATAPGQQTTQAPQSTGNPIQDAINQAQQISNSLNELGQRVGTTTDLSTLPQNADITTLGRDNRGNVTTTGTTTGGTTQSGNALSGILSGLGIQTSNQSSLTDIVKELSKLYGMDDVNNGIKKLDDDYAEEVVDINDDPWISEAIRLKRLEKAKSRYDEKKKLYTDRLSLNKDIIGQAITLYNAEKDDQQQTALKVIEKELDRIYGTDSSSIDTSDIKEYNLAKSQGYTGSFLEYQRQTANLKRTNPTTVQVTTIAASDAESQLLASRNEGPEADGVYADPNLYARLRANSALGAAEFDRRFGYLVNPISKARLGIKEVETGVSFEDF